MPMLPANSRAEYERRMHRVIAFIDLQLDQPLDLTRLAEVAHFSPYHFHRLFAAWMGETVGDYLRRRRVEVAAMRLVSQPRLGVLPVALAVGFGSGEAFSRAFRLRFGASPSAWRVQQRQASKRNPGQAKSNLDQADIVVAADTGTSFNPGQEILMKVSLVDRAPTLVAYLRHTGPYGEPISQFWQNTYYPWAAANGLLAHARYGISHDDPGIAAPEKCRYDACVEIDPGFTPVQLGTSGPALTTTIPGGRYASLAFRGPVAQMGDAWAALLRDWLPSSGLQLDARPSFEFYPRDASYDPKTGVMGCQICIPVAPL